MGSDWNETSPSGLNWWLETICAPSAWDFNNRFSGITIGIVDDGFDVDHEDLNIDVLNSSVNSKEDHGTHVAGIISAKANNNIGITGIVWNANLLGVDIEKTSSQKKQSIQVSSDDQAFSTLLDNGSKIINFSMGDRNSDLTNEEIKLHSDYWTWWISYNLQERERNDFIIIQAAGNDTRNTRQHGWFCSMDNQSVQAKLDEWEVTSFTANDVLDHIIIVGAVEKPNNGYRLTNFSNHGANISVVAPGRTIFSTVVMGGLDGNYKDFFMNGTSQAAPMVTGTAALVWSVNPNFSAAEVKTMVCEDTGITAQGYSSDTRTYNMLNAYTSVRKAVQKADSTSTSNSISGCVKDSSNGNVPLSGVTVTVYEGSSESTAIAATTTNSKGEYFLALPKGTYNIKYTKTGYSNGYSNTFTIYSNGYIFEQDTIYLSRIS